MREERKEGTERWREHGEKEGERLRGMGDEQERETKGRRKREGQRERYRQRWGKEEGRREKGGGRQRSEEGKADIEIKTDTRKNRLHCKTDRQPQEDERQRMSSLHPCLPLPPSSPGCSPEGT